MKVKLIDPATKRERFVTLERESYVEHLRALLYSTFGAGLVPYVVHQAYLNNFIPFGMVAVRFNLGEPATSRGLYFSVTCAEATPFITEREIEAETRGTFLGDRRARAHVAACAEWPQGEIPKGFTDPVESEIPIVMFSGEADGSTPPWIAEAAIKLWPNGRQIVAPHTGHQIDGPCTWDLMQAFLNAGSITKLDASCVKKAKRPRFAMNMSDLE